jgi:L-asparagine oxygenase
MSEISDFTSNVFDPRSTQGKRAIRGFDEKSWPTVFTHAVGDSKYGIARAASTITADAHDEPYEFASQTRLAATNLPRSARSLLEELISSRGNGALLLSGLMVGPRPRTPFDPVNDVTRGTLMARQTATLLAAICHLVGYRPESDGELVQSVIPTRRDLQEQTSNGSKETLLLHVEQTFNELRPDVLALGCLTGDLDAATYAISVRTLLEQLPKQHVERLWEPEFYCGVDTSFVRGGASANLRGPMAVLSGSPIDPVIRYEGEMMFSSSQVHQAALDAVMAVCQEQRDEVVLQPGDVLILDNSRVLHGRGSFQPRFDGSDRWLCRLQGRCTPSAMRHAQRPGSPVIETDAC